jgi:uncharacterized membrane protein
MSQSDNNKIPIWIIVIGCISLIIGLVAVLVYQDTFGSNLSRKHEVWAQFGDFIGGLLNPIFAFFALIALLYTIHLQSTELRNSSEQLKKSAKALEYQNNVLKKQSFESTFFQLLRLYNEIVDELKVSSSSHGPTSIVTKINHENRAALEYLGIVLKEKYIENVRRGDYHGVSEVEAIDEEYEKFYAKYGQYLGHYFRTMYNILKFIDLTDIPESEKQVYSNFLRAQLSKHELALLLYNCISRYGRKKMLPLVRKFNVIKHIEEDSISSLNHIDVFEQI